MHSVKCTGFNSQAPRLIFSSKQNENLAVLDRGQRAKPIEMDKDEEDGEVGGPLFLKLLTDNILKSFAKSQVKLLSCGFEHCIVVTESGNVVSWGYGASGCLGHGNYTSYTQPKLITAGNLNHQKVVFATCGGYHNGAITENGDLFTWGRADVGQLGLSER